MHAVAEVHEPRTRNRHLPALAVRSTLQFLPFQAAATVTSPGPQSGHGFSIDTARPLVWVTRGVGHRDPRTDVLLSA